MATPNFYILNINGVLTPGNLQGTDVASSLGLDIAPDTIGQYIADVPTLSSDLTTLSGDVSTNTSNISTLSAQVQGLNNSTLSNEISTLSSDVESLSSSVGTNTSNITSLQSAVTTLNSEMETADTNIETLQSDVSTLSSDVGTLNTEVSTIQGDLKSIGDLQTLAGTTAGNVYYSENQVGVQKRLILSFDGYENDSDVNQSITFPVAFTYVPMATSNINGLSFTVSTTELTITAPNAATTFTGTITIDGQ